jgi:hypothetical protein
MIAATPNFEVESNHYVSERVAEPPPAPKSWAPPVHKECAKLTVHFLCKMTVFSNSNLVLKKSDKDFEL